MAQTRLAVLDGLRGIAVLLVLWYHIWEISWLPAPLPSLQFIPETGFIGVDLFFFISGFVIVYPFVKALINKDVQPTWISFAYRRAMKIVPSYVLSIALVIALGYVQFASPQDAFKQIVTHLLFIHTWFPDTAGGINGVLWTLAVEVQFYAIFPLLWPAFRRWPFVTAAVMILIANAFRQYALSCCLHTSALIMIENLPSFLDTFAFGMIAAYIYVRYRENSRGFIAKGGATLAAAAGFAALAFMLHGLWTIRAQPDWSTAWAITHRTPSAFAFALMALGSLLAYRWWQRLLANPALLFFAVISYNLYLYHQALARLLLKWRIPQFTGNNEHFDPVWQVRYSIIAFVVTVVFAAAVTYAFERPILAVPLERFGGSIVTAAQNRGTAPGMSRGFTLLETIVGCAVIAIASAALLSSIGGAARFTGESAGGPAHIAAQTLAESTMRDLQTAWKYGVPGSINGSFAASLAPASGTAPATVTVSSSARGSSGVVTVTVVYTPDPNHQDSGTVSVSAPVTVRGPLPGSQVARPGLIPDPSPASTP